MGQFKMRSGIPKVRAILTAVLGCYEDLKLDFEVSPIGMTVKVEVTFNHVRLAGSFDFYNRYKESPEEIASCVVHSFMETLIIQTVKTYER